MIQVHSKSPFFFKLLQKGLIVALCLMSFSCSNFSWNPFSSDEDPNQPVELTDLSLIHI